MHLKLGFIQFCEWHDSVYTSIKSTNIKFILIMKSFDKFENIYWLFRSNENSFKKALIYNAFLKL